MPDIHNLDIASVRMHIQCNHAGIALDDDPAYVTFFVSEPVAAADMRISLETTPLPDTGRMNKIFDSEQAWAMFRDGSDYCVLYNPPVSEHPLWLARMNHDIAEVTVYCSDYLAIEKDGRPFLSNPVRYPLDQILLMYHLAQRAGALVHAAGIIIDKKGYIFPGRSGAGKTTLSRQFVKKAYADMLSDDRVAVRMTDNAFRVFGTPWPGEGGIAMNKSVVLEGIFFLAHADDNRIEQITQREAFESLIAVVSVPWYDREIMPHILFFCEELTSRVPAYRLHFRPGTEVVDILENFLSA
ncbi:MAG: hypothetical protein AB1552_03850 [Nitrospirota bacterium]